MHTYKSYKYVHNENMYMSKHSFMPHILLVFVYIYIYTHNMNQSVCNYI